MRTLCRFLALPLLCVAFAAAQTPAPGSPLSGTFYAVGVSYGSGVAGTGLVSKSLADRTKWFGVLDAVPQSLKPLNVNTNIGTGVAEKIPVSVGSVSFWVPTSAGVSWTGANVGWQWSTGVLANIPVKLKAAGFSVNPAVRLIKSSVNNASGYSGYQVIGSLLIGFGK